MMFAKETSEQSPLRILERSIHGGLGAGKLGVVMARAGVGKTAFLVQIGLDDSLRDRPVLHIALGQTLEHVNAWYEALFDDLQVAESAVERESLRAAATRNRLIQAFPDHGLPLERVEASVKLYQECLRFRPAALIVDGFDWGRPKEKLGAEVDALKGVAERLDAELWMSAQTHREATPETPTGVAPPCQPVSMHIDVAVFLEPRGNAVSVRLLKDHDRQEPSSTHLLLDPDTMRLVRDDTPSEVGKLPTSAFSLVSGGAAGTEAEFGAQAESYGLHEVTFTFAGRAPERTRGLVELSDAELQRGAVSSLYLEQQLHRTFRDDESFQKVLQTIWHQVTAAGEVFVIGDPQTDGTVRGGTGWAAALARHFDKPLHVFDQDAGCWMSWSDEVWSEVEPPRICRTRFAGTGTRSLNDTGRRAIVALFERSFAR